MDKSKAVTETRAANEYTPEWVPVYYNEILPAMERSIKGLERLRDSIRKYRREMELLVEEYS